jgi:hypothetical protein
MPTTNKNEEEKKDKIKRMNIKTNYPKSPTQTLNKRIELELDLKMNQFGFNSYTT